MTDQNSKKTHESIDHKQSEIPANAILDKENKPNNPLKKHKNFGWIILILIIFYFSANIGYRLYLATEAKKDGKTINSAPSDEASNASGATSNKSTTISSVSSKPFSSPATAPANNSDSNQTVSEKENMIEYFVDIALHYSDENRPLTTGIERWIKNPFNVGFGPDTLDLIEETCIDGFIRDFNNASSTFKLAKSRENSDIKIYKVSPEELSQYGNTDASWGFAHGYKNSSNERYKGEIFVSSAVPNNDDVKCYLMRHEMMHNMGFRGHSDRFWEGIMAVPGVDRNTNNIMSKVDTMAIKMLYNTGLSLKSTEAETRTYLNSHYPE